MSHGHDPVDGGQVRAGDLLPRPWKTGRPVRVTPLMVRVLPRLREVLVHTARRRATITYGDLATALDHAYLQQGLGPLLDVLAVDCLRRGEPRLDALVVTRAGEVGTGFDGDAARDRAACWSHWGEVPSGGPGRLGRDAGAPPGRPDEERGMGSIKVHEFTTLDGVVDAPTWTADYGFPEDLAASIASLTGSASGILLGRRTFEMFAPAWSARSDQDDPGAAFFNGSRKHVVTTTLADPGALWANSATIGGYDADGIRDLKGTQDGDLYVSGSATLVRAMLADGLVDELHLYVYPLAVGAGVRLFPEGAGATRLGLLDADRLSNGVAHLTYGPARG